MCFVLFICVFDCFVGGPWKGVGFPGVEITGKQILNRFRNPDGSPSMSAAVLTM